MTLLLAAVFILGAGAALSALLSRYGRPAALAAATLGVVGAFAVAAFFEVLRGGNAGPAALAGRAQSQGSFLAHAGPMALLAVLCIGIGVLPAPALYASIAAAGNVCRAAAPAVSGSFDEWSRLLGVVGLLGAGVWVLSALLWIYRDLLLSRRKVGHGPTWSCGFTAPTARMQYSGSSYPVPAARVFTALIGTQEDVHPPLGYWPAKASFESRTPDPALERWLPVLMAKFNEWLAVPRQLQRGRLQSYLLYVAAFLVAILLWKL